MQLLICYLSNTSFTFKLDESTSSQVTKYDAFIYNFGQMYDELVNCYCGRLFVGHCTADSFVEHIHESEKSEIRSFSVVTFGGGWVHCEQIF